MQKIKLKLDKIMPLNISFKKKKIICKKYKRANKIKIKLKTKNINKI